MRLVCDTFVPGWERRNFMPGLLPDDYDLVIFLLDTTPSTMLPN